MSYNDKGLFHIIVNMFLYAKEGNPIAILLLIAIIIVVGSVFIFMNMG